MNFIKYAAVGAVALLGASCSNIEDEYQFSDPSASISWTEAADSSTEALIAYFWNTDRHYFNGRSGVADPEPDWNYWPQAHAMDVVIDAYKRTAKPEYATIMQQWYEGVKRKSSGGYTNNFYDDEEWIALTMIRLYEATGEQKYLDTAHMLWTDILTGWNDLGGGGIAWKHDMLHAKNACSNAPASLIACRLYELEKDPVYLEWAKKIYDWTRANLFNPATGAVYDGLNGLTGDLNTVSLTYNQGTFMATAHRLYRFTGDATYLKDARRAANFCISSCIDGSNNVLRNEGNGDGALFKAVFIRYFVQLLDEPALDAAYRNKFVNFFNHNAAIAWTRGIADKRQILFGPSWTEGPMGATELNAQISGATLMEARAARK